MQFPTYADQQAPTSALGEIYGLRTQLLSGETYASSTASDVFIHGRDYFIAMPASPMGTIQPDDSTFRRTYYLLADNLFDGGGNWTGRAAFVSADRLKTFFGSLIGYPYMLAGFPALFRHLPEPFRQGPGSTTGGGQSWTWLDTRGTNQGSGTTRFDMHCAGIETFHGIAPGGNAYNDPGATWNLKTFSAIWNSANPSNWDYPSEAYPVYEISTIFKRLPYDVMKITDPAFGGEYSRFLLPQEEPATRALQVRGAVKWNGDLTQYGQPILANSVPAELIAASEGVPMLVGDNMVTWKWLDVPEGAYNWNQILAATLAATKGIITSFGYLNNVAFPPGGGGIPPPILYSPFVSYGPEVLMFRTAHRQRKGCFGGAPIWDITFYFQASPAPDGFGGWDRLLNKKGNYQRIKTNGGEFYAQFPFEKFFLSPGAW